MASTLGNRIRQLREKRGLTQGALADLMGVAQSTVNRYEKGERFPKGEHLRSLAHHLGVRPADIIDAITVADVENELVENTTDAGVHASALQRMGLRSFTVTSDSVTRAGIPKGSRKLVATSPESITNLTAGQIVVLSTVDLSGANVLVIRQFLPPNLAVTNRDGLNLAVSIGPDDGYKLFGVVVPE
jgi:transcriptional regulator with XRE-family HTH domain